MFPKQAPSCLFLQSLSARVCTSLHLCQHAYLLTLCVDVNFTMCMYPSLRAAG